MPANRFELMTFAYKSVIAELSRQSTHLTVRKDKILVILQFFLNLLLFDIFIGFISFISFFNFISPEIVLLLVNWQI